MSGPLCIPKGDQQPEQSVPKTLLDVPALEVMKFYIEKTFINTQ